MANRESGNILEKEQESQILETIKRWATTHRQSEDQNYFLKIYASFRRTHKLLHLKIRDYWSFAIGIFLHIFRHSI